MMIKLLLCLIVLSAVLSCLHSAPRYGGEYLQGLRKRLVNRFRSHGIPPGLRGNPRLESIWANHHVQVFPPGLRGHPSLEDSRTLINSRNSLDLERSDEQETLNSWNNFRRRYDTKAAENIEGLPIWKELKERAYHMSDMMLPSEIEDF